MKNKQTNKSQFYAGVPVHSALRAGDETSKDQYFPTDYEYVADFHKIYGCYKESDTCSANRWNYYFYRTSLCPKNDGACTAVCNAGNSQLIREWR